MNYRYCLLMLVCCLLCLKTGARKLHTYSLTGRLGVVPFGKPSDVKDVSDPNVKVSMLGGLKFAYEDRIAQIGVSADITKLTYDNPFTTSVPFVNTGLTVNFKISPKEKFFFAGIHAGLIIPAGEDPLSHTLSPGLAFSVGAQAGGEMRLTPHLYATAEASFRYGYREMVRAGGWSFLYFPMVIGIKYQFSDIVLTKLQ